MSAPGNTTKRCLRNAFKNDNIRVQIKIKTVNFFTGYNLSICLIR